MMPAMGRFYPTTMDRRTRFWSVLFYVFIAASVVAVTLLAGLGARHVLRRALGLWGYLAFLWPVAWLGLGFVIWCLSPSGYVLTAEHLVIVRWIRTVRILLSSIEQVRVVEWAEISDLTRIAGGYGLFGYFGLFYSPALGPFLFYSRRRTDLVGLKCQKTFYVIGPDQRAAFLQDLTARLSALAPEEQPRSTHRSTLVPPREPGASV